MSVLRKIKEILKFLVQMCLRVGLKAISLFIKTSDNRILFLTIGHKGYADNLKYVCESILNTYGEKTILTWATKYPHTCDEIKKKGIKVVKHPSLFYPIAQLKSKVVVYNDAIPPYMPKKKGQIYLNLWHGGINFKHIGYDYLFDQSKLSLKKFALGNPQPDFFISGSRFFTENTAESFRFSQDVFLPWGLPRNDVLFHTEKHAELSEKVRAFYHIPAENKIVLYAPTFRVAFASDLHELDQNALRKSLSERFSGEWTFLYRGHYFVKNDDKTDENTIDATLYPDSQELLIAADVLISDYSSMMWDMSFLRRPVFSYAPDIENYEKNERAFAYPMEKWPYDIAPDNETLSKMIKAFDDAAYQKRLDDFFIEAGSYERPDTCKKITELVGKYAFPTEK